MASISAAPISKIIATITDTTINKITNFVLSRVPSLFYKVIPAACYLTRNSHEKHMIQPDAASNIQGDNSDQLCYLSRLPWHERIR